MATLRERCSPALLTRLAGARSFERGEVYAAEERVVLGAVDERSAAATVEGTMAYRVSLRIDGEDGLRGSCTCPVGAGGAFCKHCVAVALSLAEHRGPTTGELREYLDTRSRREVTDLAIEALDRDPLLCDRLRLRMAAGRDSGVDVAALEQAIDGAVLVHDFIEYGEAWAYAERLGGVLDALEQLLGAGDATEVVELTERFLGGLDEQLGSVDDSDGGVGDALRRAEEVHLRACELARPEPEALAERLLGFALDSAYEVLLDALERYADVLGQAGVARYRALAESEWAKLSTPGAAGRSGEGRRWRVAYVMEQLALLDGDIDRLVEIKASDLSHAWTYVQIAELLAGAGRDDDALTWGERGLAALPDAPDPRLREFVADAYRQRGRTDEALALRAAQFRAWPSLENYRSLHDDAEPAGAWPALRKQALTDLRGATLRDRSTMVEILIWENDVSGAWAEAQAGGCSPALWRRLAQMRGSDRPDEAITVYRMLVDRTVAATNDSAYRDAVGLLDELRELLARSGREEDHTQVVADVRHVHRRKRNLMKLLDQQAWDTLPRTR